MSNKTQNLTIVNLDKLVEDVIEVGEPMLKHPNLELLQRIFTPTQERIELEHSHYFALFKLIYEQPEEAIEMLEKVADQQTNRNYYGGLHRHKFKKAQKGGKSFIEKSKKELRMLFRHRMRQPPVMTPYDISYFLAVVKHDPLGSLDVFQECYKEICHPAKPGLIPTIINCLKTKKFYKEGTHHFELRFVPREEKLEVPARVVNEYYELSKYLAKVEGASLENLGFIEDPEILIPQAVLIPREGDPEWKKGMYIITHNRARTVPDKIYKTEKFHTGEELALRTVGEGKAIRYTESKAQKNLSREFR